MSQKALPASRQIRVMIMALAFRLIPVWAQSGATLEDVTLHVIPQSRIDMAWSWRNHTETDHFIVLKTLELAF
jgi:hypothetical protein